MRRRWILAMFLALIETSAMPVFAHHSLVGFDFAHPTTIRGILTEIDWKNPHARVRMNVKQPDGNVVNWLIEFATPIALDRLGLRPAMFDLTSTYSLEIWPARDRSPIATGRMLTFPDGKQFDIHDIWGDYLVNK